jgi:hypothetical protein
LWLLLPLRHLLLRGLHLLLPLPLRLQLWVLLLPLGGPW